MYALVTLLFVCHCLAQSPIPPNVPFVNGAFSGSLSTQGLNIPISGTIEYLPGATTQFKTHVIANYNGNQITSDTWETITPTVLNSWEVSDIDPGTCNTQSLSGDTYPKCTSWTQSNGKWKLSCTVNVQGVQAIADISAFVDTGKQLQSFQENTTVSGTLFTSEMVKITSQSNQKPPAADFDLPAICHSSSPRLRVNRNPAYPLISSLSKRLARIFIRSQE